MKSLLVFILFCLPVFSQINLPKSKWGVKFGEAKKEISKGNIKAYVWNWNRSKTTHYVVTAMFNGAPTPTIVVYSINDPGWIWDSNVAMAEKEIMALLKLNKKRWKAVSWEDVSSRMVAFTDKTAPTVKDLGKQFADRQAVYWLGDKKILAMYTAEDQELTLFNLPHFEQEQKKLNARVKAGAKKPEPAVKAVPKPVKAKATSKPNGKK